MNMRPPPKVRHQSSFASVHGSCTQHILYGVYTLQHFWRSA